MWSLLVVVIDVFNKHAIKMSATVEEHPVQALGSHRAHEAFGERVGSRSSDRREDHLGALAAEYLIEASGELGITVTDEEPDRLLCLLAAGAEVSCLLGHPCAIR